MDVKDAIAGTIAGSRDRLTGLSHQLHAHPETAWHEERAAAWVSAELADAGFDVQTGACELPTAFIARAGTGPLHIGICAEYDALPGVGHACGHNIIAASSVGAGLALAAVADDLGLTVTVLGTPAEEGGGGKVYMLERGAFDGIHAAMMVHPWPEEWLDPRGQTRSKAGKWLGGCKTQHNDVNCGAPFVSESTSYNVAAKLWGAGKTKLAWRGQG